MVRSETIANCVSYILSPPTIAGYIIILIANLKIYFDDISNLFIVLVFALFFLCIFPVIGILIYVKKGVVDIWVSDRKMRTKFYIVAIIGYIIGSFIFYSFNQHEFFVFTLAYLVVTIGITLINLKTKISSHIAGFTGPFTAVVYLFGLPAVVVFLLLPLLMWARLKLNAHSMGQLIGGAVLGFVVTASTYLVFY